MSRKIQKFLQNLISCLEITQTSFEFILHIQSTACIRMKNNKAVAQIPGGFLETKIDHQSDQYEDTYSTKIVKLTNFHKDS